jgi:platelet-activating factor acetylhydrolase IB subunit alpha
VGHSDWVRALAVTADGKYLASASSDQSVRIWDLHSGECKAELLGHTHVVECVTFLPLEAHGHVQELCKLAKDTESSSSGRFVMSGSRDKTVRLFDTLTVQCIYCFQGHDNWVRGLVVYFQPQYVVSVSDDKTMRVWDLKTGRCCRTIDAHSHFVTCVTMSPISGLIATGSVDQTVKIWSSTS